MRGTHRLIAPQDTLDRITPHLPALGVTRCADITDLDRIGIPVYCAIRPINRSVSVSYGKGLCSVDAKVSACMEAAEFHHAEHPLVHQHGSTKAMLRTGRGVIAPDSLTGFRSALFWSNDLVIDWVKGEELVARREAWLPAAAAYICAPLLFGWSTNGLASGNHLVEATLHGLYEVVERDAVSRLANGGRIDFSTRRCRCIDLKTVADVAVAVLRDRIAAANIKLVLLRVRSCIPVHTFMAVLLDRKPFGHASTINIGSGTHLSASVAAVRAITESVQFRATFIHGSREGLNPDIYLEPHHKLFNVFDHIQPTADWRRLRRYESNDLQADYNFVIDALARAGHRKIFRADMTRRPFDIPVVKVWVPGLRMERVL